ncbi:MAG: dioxygenase [Gammaproteobacteria bacterium]|nr:dioxygenase [Gammaproteobacteria bacterium]
MSNNATILFFPHGGGPLPLLNEPGHAAMNRFLRSFPETIAQPEAIIVISAHWEEPVIAVTAAATPPLLFDYTGFPAETYEYQYPSPGHPELAGRVQSLLQRAGIDSSLDHERGFDHGVFVPLMLMYPEADIPCIQISLAASLDAAEHVRIGKALAELNSENLLFLGSGFSFHNMKALMSKRDDSIDQRNQEFETWLAQTLSDQDLSEVEREQRLVDWESAPHARYCHPREEHLLPLQVCYGIGQSAAATVFQEKVAGFIASAYQWD